MKDTWSPGVLPPDNGDVAALCPVIFYISAVVRLWEIQCESFRGCKPGSWHLNAALRCVSVRGRGRYSVSNSL